MDYLAQLRRLPLLALLCSLIALVGCNRTENVAPVLVERATDPRPVRSLPTLLILNEGNMGSNKASLDAFDYRTGIFSTNLFPSQNPQVKRELGDVGNDLGYYEGKVFAVINVSNLVEVMDARTLREVGTIAVPNCRYLAYHDGYVYLSSYAGPVELNGKDMIGRVYKINAKTLQIVGYLEVGYQPDQMEVIGDKLYVVNSGGYRINLDRDNRLSVIDLKTFTHERFDTLAMNMTQVKQDPQGRLWIASAGNYVNVRAQVLVYDPVKRETLKTFAMGLQSMWMAGDQLYAITSTSVAGEGNSRARVIRIDTRTMEIADNSVIKDGTDRVRSFDHPFGVTVHPETGEIFVAVAGNYVSPGDLYVYNSAGRLLWQHKTGDIPGHFLWLPHSLELNN